MPIRSLKVLVKLFFAMGIFSVMCVVVYYRYVYMFMCSVIYVYVYAWGRIRDPFFVWYSIVIVFICVWVYVSLLL